MGVEQFKFEKVDLGVNILDEIREELMDQDQVQLHKTQTKFKVLFNVGTIFQTHRYAN